MAKLTYEEIMKMMEEELTEDIIKDVIKEMGLEEREGQEYHTSSNKSFRTPIESNNLPYFSFEIFKKDDDITDSININKKYNYNRQNNQLKNYNSAFSA